MRWQQQQLWRHKMDVGIKAERQKDDVVYEPKHGKLNASESSWQLTEIRGAKNVELKWQNVRVHLIGAMEAEDITNHCYWVNECYWIVMKSTLSSSAAATISLCLTSPIAWPVSRCVRSWTSLSKSMKSVGLHDVERCCCWAGVLLFWLPELHILLFDAVLQKFTFVSLSVSRAAPGTELKGWCLTPEHTVRLFPSNTHTRPSNSDLKFSRQLF